jgi:hypothetical protein
MINRKTLKPKALVPFVEYDNVVNYRGMRRQNLPYVVMWAVYYAWVIVFSTWWTASPLTENVFDAKLRSILHIINLLSSALFVLLMKKELYLYYVRAGAVLIVVGMGLFWTMPNPYMQMFSTLLIGISLGCVNAGILMPFVFALNNTEKFYAVVGSYGLINLLLRFRTVAPPEKRGRRVIFLYHAAGGASCCASVPKRRGGVRSERSRVQECGNAVQDLSDYIFQLRRRRFVQGRK